jgi:hypothetical protein
MGTGEEAGAASSQNLSAIFVGNNSHHFFSTLKTCFMLGLLAQLVIIGQ